MLANFGKLFDTPDARRYRICALSLSPANIKECASQCAYQARKLSLTEKTSSNMLAKYLAAAPLFLSHSCSEKFTSCCANLSKASESDSSCSTLHCSI